MIFGNSSKILLGPKILDSQPLPPSDPGVPIPYPSCPGIQESKTQPSQQIPALGSSPIIDSLSSLPHPCLQGLPSGA